MLPGPDYIISCPSCGNLYIKKTLTSGNTFGAQYWSDGKMEAPMLPDYPAVTKCEKCNSFFWVEEAKEHGYWYMEMSNAYSVDGNPMVKSPEEWSDAKEVHFPSFEDYYQIIHSSLITSNTEELLVRQLMWWSFNDLSRHSNVHEYSPREIEMNNENLVALEELLTDEDYTQVLLKAEINRNLGNFSKCIELLADPPEEDLWVARQIADKAKAGNRKVFRLVEEGER